MKAANSGKRKPAARGKRAPATVDEYLAGVSEPARTTLDRVRAAIRSALPPGAAEVISYGIPAFKHKGMLVWFAAFRSHCSLFPGASTIKAFSKELEDYTLSKGTIQFPVDKPLPRELVIKLVKARLAENERKR